MLFRFSLCCPSTGPWRCDQDFAWKTDISCRSKQSLDLECNGKTGWIFWQ